MAPARRDAPTVFSSSVFLSVLGALALATGAAATASLLGITWLQRFGDEWRGLLGIAALPTALALVAIGLGSIRHRHRAPIDLPWGRALACEAAVLAALAVLAAGFGPAGPSETGPGGHLGWALNSLLAGVIGGVPAAVVWILMVAVATAVALEFNTYQVAGGLSKIADRFGDSADQRGRSSDTAEGALPHGGRQQAEHPTADPPKSAKDEAADRRRPKPASKPKIRTAQRRKRQIRKTSLSGSLPSPELLGKEQVQDVGEAGLRAMADRIEATLDSFGVPATVVDIERGPAVTRFGLQPGTVERAGQTRRVPVSRITARKDDLALALAARSLRMEAPVPGRPVIGVEIPNPETHTVGLRGLIEDPSFTKASRRSPLTVLLGRDVTGSPVVADLAAMPHMLIAGATGSGKSVCMHALVLSLLFQNTPDVLRMVMVDPKRVEFGRYRKLPHLDGPVVTEITAVIAVLKWTMRRMDERYKQFAERGVRDLTAYNAKSRAGDSPLPAMVVFIDELADPMLLAPEQTEPLIMRLAQLGRATGIHLVVATQRPSTDVVTGIIKANFPARVGFAVASGTDSRVILDTQGAETLLGGGDMLYQAPDAAKPKRVQGTYVTDDQIAAVVRYWADSHWGKPEGEPPWAELMRPLDPEERRYRAAVALAEELGDVNVSLLQRRLRIGHTKAKALMARLESEGVVDSRSEP